MPYLKISRGGALMAVNEFDVVAITPMSDVTFPNLTSRSVGVTKTGRVVLISVSKGEAAVAVELRKEGMQDILIEVDSIERIESLNGVELISEEFLDDIRKKSREVWSFAGSASN